MVAGCFRHCPRSDAQHGAMVEFRVFWNRENRVADGFFVQSFMDPKHRPGLLPTRCLRRGARVADAASNVHRKRQWYLAVRSRVALTFLP